MRLQAAFDNNRADDLREFTSPEMFAELSLDLMKRGEEKQTTDVVTLDARLLGRRADRRGCRHRARQRPFRRHAAGVERGGRGALRGSLELHPSADRSAGWVLAGIQQVDVTSWARCQCRTCPARLPVMTGAVPLPLAPSSRPRDPADVISGAFRCAGAFAINHVLQQQRLAAATAAPAGSLPRIVVDAAPLGQMHADARIGRDGLLALTTDSVPAAVLTLLPPSTPLFGALSAGPRRRPHLKIEGDVMLAAAVGEVARSLRWDFEEDLSRVLGDGLAHRIGRLAQRSRAGAGGLRHRVAGGACSARPSRSRARWCRRGARRLQVGT